MREMIADSCDTSSAHFVFDWLIYFLEKDRSEDVVAAGGVQVIHHEIAPYLCFGQS